MKTILVVDDDQDVRTMMSYVLRKNRFRVLEADNGSAALALASTKKPDLIISDVMMDNMNGFMLQELLQKDPSTAKIPIILITGAAHHAGAWGANENIGYLQKPIGTNELLAVVREWL